MSYKSKRTLAKFTREYSDPATGRKLGDVVTVNYGSRAFQAYVLAVCDVDGLQTVTLGYGGKASELYRMDHNEVDHIAALVREQQAVNLRPGPVSETNRKKLRKLYERLGTAKDNAKRLQIKAPTRDRQELTSTIKEALGDNR